MRSQGGVGSGLALSTCPLCRVTRLEPCLFRVLLLRRLRFLLPLTGRNCTAQLVLELGFLGGKGFAVESVAASICREAEEAELAPT